MYFFALAVLLLIIAPGPGVLSTAGIGAAYGFRSGLAYVTGLFIGNNLVLFAVISGLAAVVFNVPVLRTVLMVASVGYLIFLAARIAFAGSRIAFIAADSPPGVLAGILLQPINPKAYAVNSALITGFAFYPDSLLVETGIKVLLINLIWIPIHLAWLWAGVAVQRLELPPRTQRFINYAMAACLLGVVALATYTAYIA